MSAGFIFSVRLPTRYVARNPAPSDNPREAMLRAAEGRTGSRTVVAEAAASFAKAGTRFTCHGVATGTESNPRR
jgi:hypothetical protein